MALSLSYLFKPHALSLTDGTIVRDRLRAPVWNGSDNPLFHSSDIASNADSSTSGYFVNVPQKALALTRATIGQFGDLKVAGKRYPPALTDTANTYTLAALSGSIPEPVVNVNNLSDMNHVLEIVLTAAMANVTCGNATLGGDNSLTGIKTEYDDHSSGTDGMTRCAYGTGTGTGQTVTKDAGPHALTAQPEITGTGAARLTVNMSVMVEEAAPPVTPGVQAYFTSDGTPGTDGYSEDRVHGDGLTLNVMCQPDNSGDASPECVQAYTDSRKVSVKLRPDGDFPANVNVTVPFEVIKVMSDGTPLATQTIAGGGTGVNINVNKVEATATFANASTRPELSFEFLADAVKFGEKKKQYYLVNFDTGSATETGSGFDASAQLVDKEPTLTLDMGNPLFNAPSHVASLDSAASDHAAVVASASGPVTVTVETTLQQYTDFLNLTLPKFSQNFLDPAAATGTGGRPGHNVTDTSFTCAITDVISLRQNSFSTTVTTAGGVHTCTLSVGESFSAPSLGRKGAFNVEIGGLADNTYNSGGGFGTKLSVELLRSGAIPVRTGNVGLSVAENRESTGWLFGHVPSISADTGAGNADRALFMIDASGELKFKAAPDFEANGSAADDNEYKVLVVQTPSGGGTAVTAMVVVTVTNVNEPNPISLLSVEPIHAGNLSQVLELKIGGGTPGSTMTLDFFGAADTVSDFFLDATEVMVGETETTFMLNLDASETPVEGTTYATLNVYIDDGDGNVIPRENPLMLEIPVVAAP